jgi:iron complex outermembrane receptor protein
MTRSRKRKLARQVGLPFATAFIAGGSHAADSAAPAEEGTGALEEITVTAQKRSEDLQKVPISLQVLGGEKLAELQVSNFDDYAKFLPSVTYISLGPGQSTLYFRGVATGSDGLHAGSAPATGTYLDEIPVTTIGGAPDIHVYDIQRVEALAGPQGTLYGASSLSGTLRIITNKPDATAFSAGYDLKADKYGRGNGGGTIEGFVNVPLTDHIAIRLVGYYDYQGGYINNVPGSFTYQRFAADGDPTVVPAGTACAPATSTTGTTGTVCPLTVNNSNIARKRQNDVASGGGRAALKIDLNDNWSILPQFIAQTQKATGDFTVDEHIPGNLNVTDYRPTYDNDTWVQSALTVQGKISNWELLYTGGWFQRKVDNQVDYSEYSQYYDAYALYGGANYSRVQNNAGQLVDPTQFTRNRDRYTKQNHELRINSPADFPLRGTAGLFYQRQTDDIRAEFRIDDMYVTNVSPPLDGSTPAGPSLQSVTNQPGVLYLSQMDRTDRDYAVFADGTYDILPSLHVSAGIRKFWVENSLYGFFGFQSYEVNPTKGCLLPKGVAPPAIVTGNRPCVDTNSKLVEDGETHRVNLTWEIDSDRMVYATYSTGFRPGGANRLTTALPYQSDTLVNMELGWKTSWFDHHLRLNGATFLEHWNNVQLATQGLNGITTIDNIGKATIKGVESELEWAAFSGLTLSFGGTYVDAKTTTDFCKPVRATGQVVTDCSITSLSTPKGSHLPVTPNFKGNVQARYGWNMGEFKNFAQAVVVHQTSSTPGIEGDVNAIMGTIPGFTTADFSVGTGRDNWKLEAYIDNAFSSYGELSRLSECGASYCEANYRSFLIKPMNFGIKFGQKF